MKTSRLKKSQEGWVAGYGTEEKQFDTMKEAAEWLDDQKEKERGNVSNRQTAVNQRP